MAQHRRLHLVATAVVALIATSVPLSANALGSHTAPAMPSLSQLEKDVTQGQTLKTFPSSQQSRLDTNLTYASYQGPCMIKKTADSTLNKTCWFGDLESKKVVVLFGDSFAAEWEPTFNWLGANEHFKVLLMARANCPFAILPVTAYKDPGCKNWKGHAVTFINTLDPSVVFFAEKNVGAVDPTAPSAPTGAYAADMASAISQINAPLKVLMLGTPYFNPGGGLGNDPGQCVAVAVQTKLPLTVCDTPVGSAFVSDRLSADTAAAKKIKVPVVSLTPLFCGSVSCPIVVNGLLTFSNEFHTPTWYATNVSLAFKQLIKPLNLGL